LEKVDFSKAQTMAINRKQVPLYKLHYRKVHGKFGGLSTTEILQFQSGVRRKAE
jgi:hypothetical protein